MPSGCSARNRVRYSGKATWRLSPMRSVIAHARGSSNPRTRRLAAAPSAPSSARVSGSRRARDPDYDGPAAGYFWLRMRLLEVELLSQRGRTGDSHRIAAEIVRLLARADPGFPILERARQLMNQE